MMKWEADVPLGPLARYRIGGPTPRLGRPRSRDELRSALGSLAGQPMLVLGTGANVLVADDGVEEAVLILGGELDYIRVEDTAIEAGAAARLPALAGTARREARVGFWFLEAVPGTVGGGLRMNAGSRDEWLWHRVEWAEAMTPEGEIERITPDQARPGYRTVDLPGDWVFLGARFTAVPGAPDQVQAEHLRFRTRKVGDQVYDLPSIGSTWKNPGPPYGSAWEIVDRVGMRGARRGDAQISERHANFIVNLGSARAADVIDLMSETRRRAHEQLGVWLAPEIHLWGFDDQRLRLVGAA